MHAPLDLMNEAHMHKSKVITITKDRKTTGNTASDTGESQENETAPVAERPSTHLRPLSILSSLSFLKLRSSDARQRTNGFQNGTCELTEEDVVLFQEKLNTTTEYTNPIEKTRKAEINPNKLHDNLKALSNTQNAHVVKDFYANVLSLKPNTTYKNHSNNLDSEEVSTQAQQNKSGYNQVNSEQVSNIYGSVGSTVGFTGSFALYNSDRKCDKGRDLMMKEQAVSLHNFDGDLKLARNTAGVNPKSWWRFEGGTFLEVRASHLLKLVFLLMIITIVITFTFHSRIRQLEVQKAEVLHELNGVKLHLEILIERMDTVVSLAIPAKSTRATGINFDKGEEYTRHETLIDADVEENLEKVEAARNGKRVLVKRSAAAAGRTTKELQYPSSSISFNALSNGSAAFDPVVDAWSTGVTPKDENLKSSKGKARHKNLSRKDRQKFRKELKDLKAAHHIELNNLKRKLSESRFQQRLTKLSCCTENTSWHNLTESPDDSGLQQKRGVRAAYLQIDGTSVNIKKPKLELIGPWYLPERGDEIGFNDLWYNNLALDANGTAVQFEESGLYMIYSQVFYQLQRSPGSNPSPLGYRIYLKKNGNNSFRRAMPIAECVPSFPTTVYQTCFTQVTWFVEAQDEIYLEHFTESLPMIDALRSGQTFLGIVQLSTN